MVTCMAMESLLVDWRAVDGTTLLPMGLVFWMSPPTSLTTRSWMKARTPVTVMRTPLLLLLLQLMIMVIIMILMMMMLMTTTTHATTIMLMRMTIKIATTKMIKIVQ